MQFDSPVFALFLLAVYGLYRVLPHRWQNRLLLLASYVFYGSWDYRFLVLIWFSTLVDYVCALRIAAAASAAARKRCLGLSIAVNLGVLGAFKYFDFFARGLAGLLGAAGIAVDPVSLHLVLPVGISFYTFQSMGYTIDVYRRALPPCRDPWDFGLFVAFFPQLVAGPIERARQLLPQVQRARFVSWEDISVGTFLLAWGLFQKVVVADNLAPVVNATFAGSAPYNGTEVLVASYAFSFQLLCDFAGYSCMAQGMARIMGFRLTTNFQAPYFASNVREFWSRWHVSLTRWFRDYVYRTLRDLFNPVARQWRAAVCVLLTFLLVGLWHGAAWSFVLWGFYAGLQFVGYLALRPLLARVAPRQHPFARGLWRAAGVLLVYHLWCLGCPLFRGSSLAQATAMYASLVTGFHLTPAAVAGIRQIALYAGFFLVVEAMHYVTRDPCVVLRFPVPIRTAFYLILFYGVAWFADFSGHDFFYFQF